jgi:hypothetical protein
MKNAFSWRIFTSFGLFISFIMILVSGVILYIFPGGRGGGFIWEMGGLTKPAWQHQHIIFGFAFSLLSLGHLFFINWKAFLSYLKTKTAQGMNRRTEMLAIIILSSFVGIGTYAGIQPFSGVLEFGRGMSKSWEPKDKQIQEPQAALLTLAELSEQPGLEGNPESPEIKLLDAGLRVDSPKQTLAEIAAINGLTPEKVYAIIASNEKVSQTRQDEEEDDDHRNRQQITGEYGLSATSRELAFRQEDVNTGTGRPNTSVYENIGTKMNTSQAPDDELHRRTTASCSSCH